ncbi:MAG: hypothetical protein GX776_09210 [Oxalobacter sp.]|nr:hypothetical protein [Oxalobacter sp.]
MRMKVFLARALLLAGGLMSSVVFAQEPVTWLDTTGNPLAKGLQMRMSYPLRGQPSDSRDKDEVLSLNFPGEEVLESLEMKVYLMDSRGMGDIFPVKGAKDRKTRHAYIKKIWGDAHQKNLSSIQDRFVDGQPAIQFDESFSTGGDRPVYLVRRVLRIFYQDRLVDLAYSVGGRAENRNLVDTVFAQAEGGLFGQSVGSIRIAGIESSVAPVMAGFDSTGHPQAKGVEVKLVYPESWQLSLKGTKNTVLFASMHRGAVTEKLNLAVYAAPPDETKALFDIKGSPAKKVRQQKWQKMLESPEKRISLIDDVTVDGLPAVLMEKVPVEGGKAMGRVTKSREMFIHHPKGLVAVTCAVTANNGNRKELEKAFSVMEKGVCRPVFDSLVFADKPPPEASGAAQPNAETMTLFDTAGYPVAGMAHLQVRYPKSWQSHPPHEKDGLLELTRRQDNVLEMMELKMADLSQEDAASIFGMEGGLSQKTRLEVARKYMKDMRDIRVVSLKEPLI